MWFLLLLFFLSPILFVITGKNVNDFIYLLLLLCVTAYPFLTKRKIKISSDFFYVLFAYSIVIGFAILNGFFRGLQVSIILKETLYYFKPILFLFFGLFFLEEKSFSKLIVWGLFIVALGSLVFYSDSTFYICK